jgi:hypothetical protein
MALFAPALTVRRNLALEEPADAVAELIVFRGENQAAHVCFARTAGG